MTEFRATPATTQAISATTETEIAFATESFDTDSVFASNRCTIPAGWNGKYGQFYGGVELAALESGYIEVQKSTNAGSSWAGHGKQSIGNANAVFVVTPPSLLQTGDLWRLVIYTDTASIVNVDPRCFFSGRVLNIAATTKDYFRAHASSTQVIADATVVDLVLGTEDFDTAGAFASSVYTVPAGHNGGFGVFSAGVGNNSNQSSETLAIYVYFSTDGGSSWDRYVTQISDLAEGVSCCTGPIALTTGHQYRASVVTDSGGFTTEASDKTFFSGEIYVA